MNTRSTFQFLRFVLGLVLLCGLALGDVSPASAALRCYVKADASGLNQGSSWANAYTSLQSALGGSPWTEVWVAAGTYQPTSSTDRTISFALKNGVRLYGGFAGGETLLSQRDPSVNPTILSGEIGVAGNSDNSYHVVVGNGTDSSALLDGFAITAGNADGTSPYDAGGGMYNYWQAKLSVTNVIFSGNSAGIGGGIYNYSSSPTLMNVTFSDNSTTYYGGGMYNAYSSPSLTNVTFSDNSAQDETGGGGGMRNLTSRPSLTNVTFSSNFGFKGGGMYNSEDSNPSLVDVIFSNNSAYEGGGMYNDSNSNPSLTNVTFNGNAASFDQGGGGMVNWQSSPSLTNVTFCDNTASYGGGIYNYSNSSPSLTNVTFSGNSATYYGGGMWNRDSSPTLTNVTFSGNIVANSDYGGGGGVYNLTSSPSLTNATFSGNSALNGGGISNASGSNPIVKNSILYGDTGGEIYNTSSSAAVSYSIVQGSYPGNGNLDANPLLKPLGNYGGFTPTMALGSNSPAIDKGTNAGCPPQDQRGVARPQDGDGNGTIICDMGATESHFLTSTCQSIAAQDGWILESAETSGVGGTMNATQTTLALGDDAADRQGRSILSFNTAGLPDNAVITSVTLKIRGAGVVGTNPFATHGNILIDMRKGPFSGNAALQLQDFQAPASKSGALVIRNSPVSGWYAGVMGAAKFRYINKGGVTQFRLRFAKDDDDDLGLDYIKFYSGDSALANRPKLIIRYYVP